MWTFAHRRALLFARSADRARPGSGEAVSPSAGVEGDWPYLWIDATYVKVRQNGRIVSVAVIVAVGVNTDGRREVLGMDIGPSEAEPFWVEFLRKLARRGLRGVKLVVSDAHEGIRAAISKILNATWQRCRVGLLKKPASERAIRPPSFQDAGWPPTCGDRRWWASKRRPAGGDGRTRRPRERRPRAA